MNYFTNQYIAQASAPPAKLNYFQLYRTNPTITSIKFIVECCTKLQGEFYKFYYWGHLKLNLSIILVRPSTFAYAASIFHRVNKNLTNLDYDKFVIATGAIYLASKVNNIQCQHLIHLLNSSILRSMKIPFGSRI